MQTMKAFRITAPFHKPLVIFARDEDRAAEIFVSWQIHNGIEQTDFVIDLEWADKLQGVERENMLDALTWAPEGIGVRYSDLLGWAVRGPRSGMPD
jgi:hypothetical protein